MLDTFTNLHFSLPCLPPSPSPSLQIFIGIFFHTDCESHSGNVLNPAVREFHLTAWIRWHLFACQRRLWDVFLYSLFFNFVFLFSVTLVQKHSQNLCAGGASRWVLTPLKALVSHVEPKLAESGLSRPHSPSLNSQAVTKGLPASILFALEVWSCFSCWQCWTLIHQFFSFLCMIWFYCLPFLQVCLTVCLSVHATYQHKGASTERLEVDKFHCTQTLSHYFFPAWVEEEEFSMLFLYL